MNFAFTRRQLLGVAGAAVGWTGPALAQGFSGLRVAAGPDRYNVDPQRFTFTVRNPHAQIAETGVRPDASFRPAPLLFERWQVRQGHYRITSLLYTSPNPRD